jgi:hypothetical protein
MNFIDGIAVHCAVSYCTKTEEHEMLVRSLLDNPNIVVDVSNEDMNLPLHYFCQKFISPSCQELGKLLIDKGTSTLQSTSLQSTSLHLTLQSTFNSTLYNLHFTFLPLQLYTLHTRLYTL